MNPNRQHRVQTTQLCYNAAEKYTKPIPADTGVRLKYDIKELRLHPGKLTTSLQEQEQEAKKQQVPTHGWEGWEDYQKTLGKLLEKRTHSAKKRRWRKNPNGR